MCPTSTLRKFYAAKQGELSEAGERLDPDDLNRDAGRKYEGTERRMPAAAPKTRQESEGHQELRRVRLLAEKVSEDDWRVMMGDHKSIHRGRIRRLR